MTTLTPTLLKKYVEQKDRLRKKNKKQKGIWMRLGAIAACFALIVSAVIVRENIILNPDNRPNIPIVNVQAPSSAPQYYGNESSIGTSVNGNMLEDPAGISVTARLIETLPDTYTFFDDWKQYEYRILRMKTVKLLRGQEMTEEFYYMVPVAFMTDFSVFDRFLIKNMAQFGYEYSVMYNKSQGRAEQFELALFGYKSHSYHLMGENFAAFDSYGKFDARLWNANDAWRSVTDTMPITYNIEQAEKMHRQENEGSSQNDLYVHLLKDISGEAANVLEQIRSFENGIFVPTFSSQKLLLRPEVQFNAVRYINGFATNEKVRVWDKGWKGEEDYTYSFTKARFSEDDMARLPDLASAFESVKAALNSGLVTPPHFSAQEKLRDTESGVFGWYAKTEDGVVGVIRVTWRFCTERNKYYYDDAYYIIEYGSDECKAADRDALLKLLGDCEQTYIYTGGYNKYGKAERALIPYC